MFGANTEGESAYNWMIDPNNHSSIIFFECVPSHPVYVCTLMLTTLRRPQNNTFTVRGCYRAVRDPQSY
ncbi:hypothetical protein FKP32DRAFT_1596764 [Trametes sanguinea]|nr:hypothetical protein FKP32DRAFT_1596764 [Trametes sanguinea]